jgi:hypothetical protein
VVEVSAVQRLGVRPSGKGCGPAARGAVQRLGVREAEQRLAEGGDGGGNGDVPTTAPPNM